MCRSVSVLRYVSRFAVLEGGQMYLPCWGSRYSVRSFSKDGLSVSPVGLSDGYALFLGDGKLMFVAVVTFFPFTDLITSTLD